MSIDIAGSCHATQLRLPCDAAKGPGLVGQPKCSSESCAIGRAQRVVCVEKEGGRRTFLGGGGPSSAIGMVSQGHGVQLHIMHVISLVAP